MPRFDPKHIFLTRYSSVYSSPSSILLSSMRILLNQNKANVYFLKSEYRSQILISKSIVHETGGRESKNISISLAYIHDLLWRLNLLYIKF